jgi:hypothetical protein
VEKSGGHIRPETGDRGRAGTPIARALTPTSV